MNATKQLSKNRAGLSITDDRPMAIRESCGGLTVTDRSLGGG